MTLEEYFRWHMPGDPPVVGCWEWPLKPEGFGYGQINYGGYHARAHVLSYRLHHGEIPAGLIVRHTCDNPICVHPNHFELGTRMDNMNDMRERGRESRRGQAKLTVVDVLEIRKAVSSGVFHHILAERYGVSRRAVGHIVRRSTWKDVREEVMP
jgi:hypothetical protein